MIIIIYLASRDDIAIGNNQNLVPRRQAEHLDTRYAHLDLIGGRLVNEERDLFNNINSNQRDNVRVEFIAHGRDNHPLQLQCLPPRLLRQGETREDFIANPETVENFFRSKATNENGQLKFSNLTLFCCQSLEFGKVLSIMLQDVKITCFHEDIHINSLGDVLNPANELATPHTFLAGVELTPHIDDLIEHNISALSYSLPIRPMVLRGNPQERFNNINISNPGVKDENKSSPSNDSSLSQNENQPLSDNEHFRPRR